MLLLLGITSLGRADNRAQQIQQLDQQIQSLKQGISGNQEKVQELQQALQQSEESIGRLEQQLEQLNQELVEKKAQLASLQNRHDALQDQIDEQHSLLMHQMRIAYQLSQQQPYFKLLLNPQSPGAVHRTLCYYQYMHRARLDLIQTINTNVHQLQTAEQQLQSETQALQKLRDEQQAQRLALQMQQTERQNILQQLNNKIQSDYQNLNTLIANKQNLERIIRRIQISATTPAQPTTTTGAHNKLPWPTEGKLRVHFGTQVEQSELKYTGVIIDAPEGQAVHSIYPGRVVFANWLPGYGLMMILDHGNGYMSLYGHNRSLYKNTGDTVRAGDMIARVGNTGGSEHSGLYFEIRFNGRPVDPQIWCR